MTYDVYFCKKGEVPSENSRVFHSKTYRTLIAAKNDAKKRSEEGHYAFVHNNSTGGTWRYKAKKISTKTAKKTTAKKRTARRKKGGW